MEHNLTPYEALKNVVTGAGSQSELARQIGVSQTTVWKWLQSSKRLPSAHVLLVERLYGVSRHDLRPDIYPRNYPPAPDAEPDLEVRFHGTDQGNDSRMYLADRRVA